MATLWTAKSPEYTRATCWIVKVTMYCRRKGGAKDDLPCTFRPACWFFGLVDFGAIAVPAVGVEVVMRLRTGWLVMLTLRRRCIFVFRFVFGCFCCSVTPCCRRISSVVFTSANVCRTWAIHGFTWCPVVWYVLLCAFFLFFFWRLSFTGSFLAYSQLNNSHCTCSIWSRVYLFILNIRGVLGGRVSGR